MSKRESLRKVLGMATGVLLSHPLITAAAADMNEEPLTVLLEPVPPFSYQDAEGRPAGYAVELVQEMLRRTQIKAVYEFNSWANVYQRALSQPRVLVVSMARLEEREPLFHWIGPTAARRVFLYRLKTRTDVQAKTLEAAKTYKIAVIRDDAAERDLINKGFEVGKNLDRSPDHAAMLRKLFAQRNDFAALNSTVAAATLSQFGYDYKQVEPVIKLSETRLFMGMSRSNGNEALSALLQRTWEAMKRDGTVAATAARHPYVVLPD